jgi:hypothetical protein
MVELGGYGHDRKRLHVWNPMREKYTAIDANIFPEKHAAKA